MKMDSGERIVEESLNHNEPDSEKSLMREKVTNGCKRQATIGRRFVVICKVECVKFLAAQNGMRKSFSWGAN